MNFPHLLFSFSLFSFLMKNFCSVTKAKMLNNCGEIIPGGTRFRMVWTSIWNLLHYTPYIYEKCDWTDSFGDINRVMINCVLHVLHLRANSVPSRDVRVWHKRICTRLKAVDASNLHRAPPNLLCVGRRTTQIVLLKRCMYATADRDSRCEIYAMSNDERIALHILCWYAIF